MNHDDEDVKEDFCPSCLVMPLAFVSSGAMLAGKAIPQKHKKWKRGLMISGVVSFVALVILIIYYFLLKKGCKDGMCKL